LALAADMHAESRGATLGSMNDQPAGDKIAGLASRQFDVFIAHASEDKQDLVRPLAARLDKYRALVWYDEFMLRAGDSLIAKIDEGLARSNYGVLVLSPDFLGKPWPEYERQGLTARDVDRGGSVLIPIWHGVTVEQVRAFSPTLAQRLALRTDDLSIDELTLRILELVRPDLAEGPLRLAAFERLLVSARVKIAPVDSILRSDRRHARLETPLLRRLRLIHGALFEVQKRSWDDVLDDFLRELYPEREIEVWESIAALYLQIVREYSIEDAAGKREVFALLLTGSTGAIDASAVVCDHIPPELATTIREAYLAIRGRRAQ
jgi:hypothetical protein